VLTRLDLQHSSSWRSGLDLNSSSITAALAQLSGLRSLQLTGSVQNACIAAVGQLAHLTHLSIDRARLAAAGCCDLHLLPQQLQDLTFEMDSEGGAVRGALGHITALRDLGLYMNRSAAAGSSLPTSLTALTLRNDEAADTADSEQHWGILGLQQLQWLEAGSWLQDPMVLMSLSTITTLTFLDRSYVANVAALHASPVWQLLPALHTLFLEQGKTNLDPAHSLMLLKGLAAATSLVDLSIEGRIVHESVQLCVRLTGLTRLQDLEIDGAHLASRADALHLTALTSLTRLEISEAPGVDNTAASALALHLKQLQELQFSDCGLRSAAALPSIATLTGLTRLCLYSTLAVGQLPLGRDELMLLTPLMRLQNVCFRGFFSYAAWDELWDDCLNKWQLQQPEQSVQQW
jgi:hypothetical protein